VSQMDEVTQQNAALVEEAAAAAESLQEQAQSLVRSVAVFRLAEEVGSVLPALRQAQVMDVDAAISAHRSWRRRLLEYVGGKGEALDPAIVGRDDKCALGCWIYGAGQALQDTAQYGALKHAHAAFHRCAAEVVRKYQHGDSRGARSQIAGEFSDRSDKVVALLEEMKGGARRQIARAAQPIARIASGHRPAALSAPRDDDWEEF